MITTGRVWFFTQAGVLLLASLWIITNPIWHSVLFLTAVLMNVTRGVSWKIWLLRILPFLILLLVFQLIVTPFYRPLLQQIFTGQIIWSEWWTPLIGLMRLGTPFLVITAFADQFTQPNLMEEFVKLLTPLRWLGLKVERVQMVLPLSLRFFPILMDTSQRIHENLAIFNNSESTQTRHLKLRIIKWNRFYRTVFSHSIEAAVQAGEALALRGWQPVIAAHFSVEDGLLLVLSLVLGGFLFFCKPALFVIWLILLCWLGLVFIDLKVKKDAYRPVN